MCYVVLSSWLLSVRPPSPDVAKLADLLSPIYWFSGLSTLAVGMSVRRKAEVCLLGV